MFKFNSGGKKKIAKRQEKDDDCDTDTSYSSTSSESSSSWFDDDGDEDRHEGLRKINDEILASMPPMTTSESSGDSDMDEEEKLKKLMAKYDARGFRCPDYESDSMDDEEAQKICREIDEIQANFEKAFQKRREEFDIACKNAKEEKLAADATRRLKKLTLFKSVIKEGQSKKVCKHSDTNNNEPEQQSSDHLSPHEVPIKIEMVKKYCKCKNDYCKICEKFVSRLRRHVLIVHLKIKRFKCRLCGYRSYFRYSTGYHMLKHGRHRMQSRATRFYFKKSTPKTFLDPEKKMTSLENRETVKKHLVTLSKN